MQILVVFMLETCGVHFATTCKAPLAEIGWEFAAFFACRCGVDLGEVLCRLVVDALDSGGS